MVIQSRGGRPAGREPRLATAIGRMRAMVPAPGHGLPLSLPPGSLDYCSNNLPTLPAWRRVQSRLMVRTETCKACAKSS